MNSNELLKSIRALKRKYNIPVNYGWYDMMSWKFPKDDWNKRMSQGFEDVHKYYSFLFRHGMEDRFNLRVACKYRKYAKDYNQLLIEFDCPPFIDEKTWKLKKM